MKAIIVGGGIGGLTTALMLRARGIGCELFEQSDSIRELGVGINTLPHAIRELAGLGLLQKLDDVAIRTDELYYLNRHGQEVWRESRGIDAGHSRFLSWSSPRPCRCCGKTTRSVISSSCPCSARRSASENTAR